MVTDIKFPIRIPAIRIEQPIGEFYLASIEAKLLLEVAYSTPAKVIEAKEGGYKFIGGQRDKRPERLRAIARYIDGDEATFPNSIILGANFHEDGSFEENEDEKWYVEKTEIDEVYNLIIPTNKKLASIIDGQHRLFSFDLSDRKTMKLSCSVFLDLPLPYHAHIFATININQKKVDRSLALELFGFNLENESAETWSPETFAVYLARVLNTDKESPLFGNIMIGIQDEKKEIYKDKWAVSMATIVDGILKLISSDPKKDRDVINKSTLFGSKNRIKLEESTSQPLREYYLEQKDLLIYDILCRYFISAKNNLLNKSSERSYIKKTVGMQALFDILKLILTNDNECKVLSDENGSSFNKYLEPSSNIDFSNPFFQASGKGRVRIKNIIAVLAGFINIDNLKISTEERAEYSVVLNKYS